MRVLTLSLLLCLTLVSCKGSKGETGPRGTDGASNIKVFSGSVSNNDFVIASSFFSQAKSGSVYLSDGTTLTESPYFLPAQGVNTFWVMRPASGQVEIVNAALAGAVSYIIVIEL